MSRRKRRSKGGRAKKAEPKKPIAWYECQGCGREWGEDLLEIHRLRLSGQLPETYSGTNCSCGHPYIKWTNYGAVAPRLRTGTDRTDGGPE